jgi:hypothetical protein
MGAGTRLHSVAYGSMGFARVIGPPRPAPGGRGQDSVNAPPWPEQPAWEGAVSSARRAAELPFNCGSRIRRVG